VLAPVLFFVHSQRLGFGFLLLLSALFLGNTLLGYLHPQSLGWRSRRLSSPWMVIHVAASVVVTVLAVYHGWIVFYFE